MDRTSAPLVSVIVATYNSSRTLRYTLAAILQQTFTDFELLVIGDACTDNSAEVVSGIPDSRIQWINLEQRIGSQSGPNNEGLRRARGKYIAFCGHDDLWFPDHLEHLVQHLELHDLDLTYALSLLINPEGVYAVIGAPPAGKNYGEWHIPPSSWLLRKSVVASVGLWPDMQAVSRGVDEAYLGLVFQGGCQIAACPQQLILKFPSAEWVIYDQSRPFPQKDYFEQLVNNEQALKEQLLSQLGVLSARYYKQFFPFRFHLVGLWKTSWLRSFLWRIMHLFSIKQRVQMQQFQATRKEKLKSRGLVK